MIEPVPGGCHPARGSRAGLLAPLAAAACCLALWFGSAQAVLDVDDRGPVLDAGNFRMRVTNAGILGNAFYNVGRSSDPSFEYPAYSGIEMLNHAELWVGALDEDNATYVSGGPMLEWRPTLDPNDRVLSARRDRLGTRRLFDDDGDGRVDEEVLNGKDDDGDGEVDEDLGLFSDELMAADYVDDRPEAVNYGYPTGETHHALGLSVHQECYAWSMPGYDGIAGLSFHITNHGQRTLRNLYLGLFADLDSRLESDATGHRNDRVQMQGYAVSKFEGLARVLYQGVVPCAAKPCPPPPIQCFTKMSGSVPVVFDGQPGSGLPAIGLMGLDHTTDPFARILPAAARAPATVSFRTTIFDAEGIPNQGGPPVVDVDRYRALAGTYPGVPSIDRTADWIVLVSCGPFASLAPGQSLDLTMALVAAPSPDSIEPMLERTALMFIGTRLDTIPNDTTHPDSAEYTIGRSGVAGHEVCLAAPPGFDLFYDPDCSHKMGTAEAPVEDAPIHYPHDHCIWTDTDCDVCTGLNGKETVLRWLEPAEVSPSPNTRVIPGDHRVTIEWDNTPEVLLGNQIGLPGSQFVGYRVYKLANWHNRQSLLPPEKNWALIATYASTSGNGETPLASITDSTLDYSSILYERKLYPVGRYKVVDTDVLDGFDYVYVVTTVHTSLLDLGGGVQGRYLVETPLIAKFDDKVTPHTASTPSAGHVTVVPNPFRGGADWDRGAVFGDPLPRHIDFMHLPRGRSTIKIYTLAGDFVAQIDHDGSQGDGQASWDLISRKGQDVESGIYLFTVDSPLGHQVGKFVLIR